MQIERPPLELSLSSSGAVDPEPRGGLITPSPPRLAYRQPRASRAGPCPSHALAGPAGLAGLGPGLADHRHVHCPASRHAAAARRRRRRRRPAPATCTVGGRAVSSLAPACVTREPGVGATLGRCSAGGRSRRGGGERRRSPRIRGCSKSACSRSTCPPGKG